MKAQTVREQIEPFSRGRLGCSKYGDISDRDDPLGKRALEWPLRWGSVARGALGLVGVFPHIGLCYLGRDSF